MSKVEDLFDKCSCGSYNLIGTNYYFGSGFEKWTQTEEPHIKCTCRYKCCCPCTVNKFYTAEEVFDSVPEEVRDRLLFHLDVFLKLSSKKAGVTF